MAKRVRRGQRGFGYRYRPGFDALEPRLLLAADFGDAPSPYATLLDSNGARHEAVGPMLGLARDIEGDGQISAGAIGDDNLGTDDEDGITWGTIRVGQIDAVVTVAVSNAPGGAKLDAWIDFNGDGSWDSAEDQIATSVLVVEGSNSISFDVPAEVAAGQKYARFRLSTAGGLSPSGAADDGEVEDLPVNISPPAQTFGLFGHERVAVPMHNDATSVTAADIDADGDVDLVSASRGGSILLSVNDGQGNFATQTVASGVGTTWKVRTADIDNDGDIDVISAGENANAIGWHENKGGGVFQRHTITATASTLYDVWASDLDSDGDVDLLAGGAWYENDGAENFTTRSIANPSSNLPAIRVADVDRDGDMDIVAATGSSPALYWYENDGAENFTRHLIVTASNLYSWDAQVGDIDRDGDMDIVVGYASETTNRVRWYRNDGSGTFQENAVFTGTSRVMSVELADLDGDNDLDIVTGTDWASSGTIFFYKNNALGTFSESSVFSTSYGSEPNIATTQVIPADVDGDGDFDLVSTISDSNPGEFIGDRLSWFENTKELVSFNTSGPNSPQEANNPVFTSTFARSGDTSVPLTIEFAVEGTATFGSDYVQSGATTFNGQHGSIVIPANSSSASLTVSVQDDSVFEPNETLRLRPLELGSYALDKNAMSPWTWTIFDTDPGDYGDAPAPYPSTTSQQGAAHGAVGPRLGSTRDAETNGQPTANASGDDEAADPTGGIVFGTVRVGQQNATVTVDVQNAPAGARVDAWLDFNRDGHWDGVGEQILASIVVHEGMNQLTFDVPSDAQSGQAFARFRVSTAGGLGIAAKAIDGEVEDVTVTLQPPVASSAKFAFGGAFGGGNMSRVEAVDLDNDDDLDLVWNSFDAVFRGVYWSENTGAGFTRPPNLVDADALNFSIGDITNDGIPDIATVGDGRRTFVFQNDGLGHFTGAAVLPLDAPYYVFDALQLVDLDQDGDLDFVGSAESGFAWIENLGSGQFATRWPVRYGGPAVGTPADFDRDGDLDFLAPGTNYWMENTGDFVYAKRFLPTPNSDPFKARLVVDLDQDGNLDIVGTDSNNRLVWLRNNGNRTFTPRPTDYYVDLQLTVSGSSALTVGDVNGDGFIDIVGVQTPQYREDRGGVWYKNDGAGNFTRQVFFTDAHPYALQAARLADLDNDGDLDFFGTTSWIGATWYCNVSTGVTIAVDPLQVSESGAQGLTYTFHRIDSVRETLSVNFDVSGSASYGADYAVTGAASFSAAAGTIVFPVGVDTVQITIVPSDDDALESRETVILSLAAGDDYVPEGNVTASGTITDDEPGDFGDAPAPYATTHAANGASHFASGPTLGSLRDEEPNGQPMNGASGDDAARVSDEDGVQFGTVRVGALGAVVIVNVGTAPAGAYLDAWIDFNGDGNWDGPLEAIATRHLVHDGDNAIMFDVPSAAISGTTYARFRLSSSGGLGPYGFATDGEVEDHAVVIDAPKATPATFSARRSVGANAYADTVSAGDFDGDGDTDLVAISESYARLTWYENDGRGQFAAHIVATGADGHVVLIVDLDQDQDLDIVAGGDYGLHAYLNDGASHFVNLPIHTDTFVDLNEVVAADFNGDGRMDLLVSDELGASNTVTWLENKGLDGFVEQFVTDRTGSVGAVDVADFDGDGDIDFVTPGSSSDEGVRWYENDGFANFTYHTLPALSYPGAVRAADIDGDGATDILVGGNGLWVYFNDGAGVFHSVAITNGITNAITCADLDGDGDLDLATSVGSGPRQLRRYLNDGSGAFVLQIVESSYQVGYRTNVADIDGDGALDLLSTSSLAWFRNLGPLAGDFNQDQVVDGGDYVLWRKTRGMSVPKYSGADADGDGVVGAADYAVWRRHFGDAAATVATGSATVEASDQTAQSNSVEVSSVDASFVVIRDVGDGSVASAGAVEVPETVIAPLTRNVPAAPPQWAVIGDFLLPTMPRPPLLQEIVGVNSEQGGEDLLPAALPIPIRRTLYDLTEKVGTLGELRDARSDVLDHAFAEFGDCELKVTKRRRLLSVL